MKVEHRKVSIEQEKEVCRLYAEELYPMTEIGKKYGVTRQGIWKILAKNGVDTKKSGTNARPEVSCHHCGTVFKTWRMRVRKENNLYCSKKCYYEHLACLRTGSVLSRYGMMTARKVVSEYFELKGGMVVHHVDGNDTNNEVSNLVVYATNGDHTRAHRGYPAMPVWVGADAKEKL